MKATNPELKVPKSNDERCDVESVGAAVNHGACVEPKTFDAGADSGPGVWIGDGLDVKFVPAEK